MKQDNLIILPPEGKVVFVGDTHGDLEASQTVVKRYLKQNNKIVFLGDYVDRGLKSKENIDYLIEMRDKNPKNLYLLLGNHDACQILGCRPRDFWDSLSKKEVDYYAEKFSDFPLAVSVGNIIALHGGLPDIDSIKEINPIPQKSDNWVRIIWGDFKEVKGDYIGEDYRTGRPKFGEGYFNRIMDKLGKDLLIRSHQSRAQLRMYGNRCLTIFTSSAYFSLERTIAIADLEKRIKTTDDLIINEI